MNITRFIAILCTLSFSYITMHAMTTGESSRALQLHRYNQELNATTQDMIAAQRINNSDNSVVIDMPYDEELEQLLTQARSEQQAPWYTRALAITRRKSAQTLDTTRENTAAALNRALQITRNSAFRNTMQFAFKVGLAVTTNTFFPEAAPALFAQEGLAKSISNKIASDKFAKLVALCIATYAVGGATGLLDFHVLKPLYGIHTGFGTVAILCMFKYINHYLKHYTTEAESSQQGLLIDHH